MKKEVRQDPKWRDTPYKNLKEWDEAYFKRQHPNKKHYILMPHIYTEVKDVKR